MAKRRRIQLPASLLRELIPTRPSPVDRSVYDTGPTARTLNRPERQPDPEPQEFVVVAAGEHVDERHAAAVGDSGWPPDAAKLQTLCGLPVRQAFLRASVLIVECGGCVPHLPLPGDYT